MDKHLKLDNISVGYDTDNGFTPVVTDLSLGLDKGHIGCLLGASGCGKTTALRAIAGFEPLTNGAIYLGNHLLSDANIQIAPEKRNVGMMFQDYALFPHLNVEQNLVFGLRKWDKDKRNCRAQEMLDLIGLNDFKKKYPHELSGGQQQRVALARALAPQPSLLLLDEPFSNLDVDTREKLAFEVRDILKKTGHTALLVTHNQAEAFAIADKIGVMLDGNIAQWGSPHELHNNPNSEFIADFVKREALINQRNQAFLRVEN